MQQLEGASSLSMVLHMEKNPALNAKGAWLSLPLIFVVYQCKDGPRRRSSRALRARFQGPFFIDAAIDFYIFD